MNGRFQKLFFLLLILIAPLFFLQCTSIEKISSVDEIEIVDDAEEILKKQLEEEKKIQQKKIDLMNATVQSVLDGMTLEQKIGQMLMPSMYKGPVTSATSEIKNAIKNYGFGGVIFFKKNITSANQTAKFIYDLQSAATDENATSQIPLLVGIDQEGGMIVRLTNSCWMPGNMLVGASGNVQMAKDYAQLVGDEISSLGFNLNFAPVSDVNCNPQNPIIGLRSFSSDPNLVAKMICGSIEGYKNSNVICSLKHFPGHGDTNTDSHFGLPLITKSYEQMKKMELVPFAAGIKSGAEMIMTAHIQFPDIEDETYRSVYDGARVNLPATLSKKILTGVLREQLGFDGVVITDAMDMGAITTHFRKTDAAKLAINAGVDILLMICDLSNTSEIRQAGQLISSIASLVKSGEISEDRINESVTRILKLKYNHGLLDANIFLKNQQDLETQISLSETFVSSMENHKKEWAITESGITVVKNENNLLPLDSTDEESVGVLYPFSSEWMGINYAIDFVKEKFPDAKKVSLASYSGKSFSSLSSWISKMDTVVIISELSQPNQFNQFANSGSQFGFVNQVIKNQHKNGKKVVLVSAELPYDIAAYSDADAIVACYGAYEMKVVPTVDAKKNQGYGPNMIVALASVFGAAKADGKLPVDIFALDKNYKYTDQILYPVGTAADFNCNSE